MLAAEVTHHARLTIRSGIELLSFERGKAGFLAGINFTERGERATLKVEGVFVAHDPVVYWGNWGGREGALALEQRGKLVLAGLAAGVPYADHSALYASGVLAARQLLER